MQLNELLLTEEQLNELTLKQTVAAGLVALSALTASREVDAPVRAPSPVAAAVKQVGQKAVDIAKLAKVALDKYNINQELAVKVAALALKHEYATFPKAEDILAVIGIESSFRPHVKSSLKHDPAIGLMQVRPKVWKLQAHTLSGNIEAQVEVGADILHKYYTKLGSKEAAVHAYNVGITSYLKKQGLNPSYVTKFNNERALYKQALKD